MKNSVTRKSYSPRALAQATLAARKLRNPNFVDLASTFGVPAATLRQHVNGLKHGGVVRRLNLGAKSRPSTALSSEAENHLHQYIAQSRKLCTTVDKAHILQKAVELERIEDEAKEMSPRWPEGKASEKWWLGFRSRKWVVLRCCQDLELDRLQSQSPEIITNFQRYQEAKGGISENGIFNWDETGLMRVGRWSKGVAEKRNARPVKRSSGKATGA